MTRELWRRIPSWEQWYAISNHGRVRRLQPGPHTRIGRVLKNYPSAQGPMVHLTRMTVREDGTWGQVHGIVLVHREVYSLFVGPIPGGYLVVFRDGDRGNPRADNLEAIKRPGSRGRAA